VDQAIYVGGARRPCMDLSDELATLREEGAPGDFLWVGLKDPTQAEFDEVNDELGLHSLAVEDAIKGRQRAKVELYDNTVFVVLKPLRYLEESSDIETGELMCFIGDHFLVTVRRGEASPLAGLRERLEKEPALLRHGPMGVLHAIVDTIVDTYRDIELELGTDLEDIEEQVFSACTVLNTVTPDYRGPSGKLIDQDQGRDWAWSMRDLVLAYALLRTVPGLDWLPSADRFDAILAANLDRAVKALAVPGMGQLGMFWEGNAYDSQPNPTFWPSIRTGQRPGVYTGSIVNYIAYTLDWGRRLHPDPRWSQLQIAFAERFQARRFLASGPFCFLNLPARLEGRWFSDWRQMAQVLGLPADIARQPWYSFDLPVNDPRVYEYTTEYPATFYHGLKLAQATGTTNADVDTAVALLEAQIRRGDEESYPAFAMRHAR